MTRALGQPAGDNWARFEEGLDDALQQLIALNSKVDALSHKLDRMVALDSKVDTLDGKVDALDHKVDDALDRKVDASERAAQAMDRKVDALDRTLQALDLKVTVSNQNAAVRNMNTLVVYRNMSLEPFYSVLTGELIKGFPDNVDQMESLQAGEVDDLLRHLGHPPVVGSVAEKRRALVLASGPIKWVI